MNTTKKGKELLVQIEDLQLRLDEALDTLRAIRNGEVDALVVSTQGGDQIYTLKGANQVYRLILETLNEGVLTVMPDGHILYCNNRFAEMIKRPMEKVIGSSIYDYLTPVDQSPFRNILEQDEIKRIRGEISLRTGDETFLSAQFSTNPLKFDGTSIFCLTAVDLTEQKRSEETLKESKEQLRILASQILFAQENERKRIAREIHDVLGSSLSAIKYKVEEVLVLLPKHDDLNISKPLEILVPVIQDTIEEARRIQTDLRPPLLDDLGIIATLSWFCRRFQTIYSGIKVEEAVTIREEEVPEHLKISLFRIAQEAMNNISKYARADSVHLGLQKGDGTIELRISDNGEGFDLESLSSREILKKGVGLSSMKERVEFSGGSFSIESTRGKGTVIRAVWPV